MPKPLKVIFLLLNNNIASLFRGVTKVVYREYQNGVLIGVAPACFGEHADILEAILREYWWEMEGAPENEVPLQEPVLQVGGGFIDDQGCISGCSDSLGDPIPPDKEEVIAQAIMETFRLKGGQIHTCNSGAQSGS